MFGAVGVSCTLTDLIFYGILITVGAMPLVANFFGFFIANIQGYVLNGRLTFRASNQGSNLTIKGYLKYLTGYLVALVVSSLIIWWFSGMLGPWGAKFLAIAVTMVWTYLVSVLFVFRDPTQDTGEST